MTSEQSSDVQKKLLETGPSFWDGAVAHLDEVDAKNKRLREEIDNLYKRNEEKLTAWLASADAVSARKFLRRTCLAIVIHEAWVFSGDSRSFDVKDSKLSISTLVRIMTNIDKKFDIVQYIVSEIDRHAKSAMNMRANE